MTLNGCAAAVDDDGTLAPSEEAPGSTSEALKEATVTKGDAAQDADAGCDAAPAKSAALTDPYQQYLSIVDPVNSSVDAAPVGNSCSAACRCCSWGNRFCCSHCKWCSWPVATNPEVLAP